MVGVQSMLYLSLQIQRGISADYRLSSGKLIKVPVPELSATVVLFNDKIFTVAPGRDVLSPLFFN